LNFDGTIPDDNPLIGSSNNVSSIFSFGHRNPQGLEFNPYNNNIVSTEHGPQGGDEVNIIVKGENYGWPIVSYGINYDDSDISGKSHNGYKEPVFYWDPSIATSQIILLKDKNHNDWFRSYLVCGMKSNAIHRIGYVGGELIEFEKINMGERVRSIVNGKDGAFYASTDSGKIIKFSPK
jgi:glucose/arabinose dehydrogenase